MAKLFVHFNTKTAFTGATKGTEYDDTSIVFIKDTQEIWTHGQYYAIPDAYKTKITNLETKVDTLEKAGYATKAEVDKVKSDLTALITAISSDYVKAADIADMATKTWIGQQGFLKEADLEDYALAEDVTEEIAEAVKNKADKATTLGGYGITDAKFGTEGDKNIQIQLGETVKTVLTAHQDITGKADKTWVEGELADKADASALGNYILKTQPTATAVANDPTKKTLAIGNLSQEVLVAHQDISGKADVSTVNALDDRVEDLEDVIGSVTDLSAELAKKADKSEFTQLQITVGNNKTDADNKISGLDTRVKALEEGMGEGIDAAIEEAIEELKGDSDYDTFDDIQEAIEAIDGKIDALDLTAVGGANKLITTVSQTDGKVAASAIEVGDGLEVATDKLKVKLAEANKVLSVNSNGLLASITLDYATKGTLTGNTDKEVIQLKGANNVVISEISAEPFLMDRFLKDVDLDGSELTFTFEVKHGTDSDLQDITIDLSEYIKVYTEGNGIKIANNVVSVEIKEGETYLEVGATGLATKGIDAAITKAVGDAKTEIDGRLGDLEELVGEDSVDEQIETALEDLTVGIQGGTGKYVQSVKQDNGKITAVAADLNATAVAATAITGGTATNVQGILNELAAMWTWGEY